MSLGQMSLKCLYLLSPLLQSRHLAIQYPAGGRGNGANGGAWNDTPMSPRSPSSEGADMDEYKASSFHVCLITIVEPT
jgi:hypothetical protein